MVRHFYLLCLLIAIDCSFCYDSISDRNSKRKHERRLSKKDKFQHHKQKHKAVTHNVGTKKQEYNILEDKEPIAQIDVASFIHKPDEYAFNDNFNYGPEVKKSKANLKNYDYGTYLYNTDEGVVKRSNKRPYYRTSAADNPELGLNPFSLKNIKSRHLNLEGIHGLNNGNIGRNVRGKPSSSSHERALYDTDSNIAHNPEKKCVLKNMVKIPFFSHNKSETAKSKKAKKRKIFCFNCGAKNEKENNSGEFSTRETLAKENMGPKVTLADTGENAQDMKSYKVKRGKRQLWLNDRERQLKELDEIQRKVDNVEILPTYEPLSQK